MRSQAGDLPCINPHAEAPLRNIAASPREHAQGCFAASTTISR